jgi:RHS repeat-associated protein
MPGRKYPAAGGLYRYGFNGKENDNEVKGEGNQQDYGMRIYDPRLMRFLSVDPLANSYPWYTPYQFAGNDVIRCIDLDGAEPTMRTENYSENYKPFIGGGCSIDVYDKVSHSSFHASGIFDPNTGKTYIIAEDEAGQNKYFYLVNDGGATDKISWKIENGRNVLVGGKFVQYETQNDIDTRTENELCDATGVGVFVGALIVTAYEAGVGIAPIIKAKKELDKTNQKEQPELKKDEPLKTKVQSSNSTKEKYSKKEARENAKKERENQPASENYVKKYRARELEKKAGKDSRRKAHDEKEKGGKDRTRKQIDEDYSQ